ncbi:MAG: hypothetical protein ABII01_05925 [Candidatus Woesearchaeota archaeon]
MQQLKTIEQSSKFRKSKISETIQKEKEGSNKEEPIQLKLSKPEEHDEKFLFLYELINVFIARLNIKNTLFYSKLNQDLKLNPAISKLSCTEHGLTSFEPVFEDYQTKRESGYIYEIAPYFAALSRILSLIYKESVKKLGKEEADKILKKSFFIVKKKYSENPDLLGYIPPETMGLSSSSSAFGTTVMGSMIDFLIDDVIKNCAVPVKLMPKQEKLLLPKEQITEGLKMAYAEMLGPLGSRQLNKIKKMNLDNVLAQIDGLKHKHIISEKKAREFTDMVNKVFEGKIKAKGSKKALSTAEKVESA